MKQLTRRVWYLPHSPASDRPALGYIRGDRRALMVDAGNSPAHVRQFLRSLEAEGLPAPDLTVLTHRHWDHTFGLAALPIPAVAGAATARYLERFSAIRWGEAGLQEYIDLDGLREFSEPHLRLEYPDPATIRLRPADMAFTDTLEVELGGCRCLLRTIPSPHCDDCVLVHVPSEGVIFPGDSCCLHLVRGDWVEDPAGTAALLAVLETLSFDVAVVGHDDPVSREALLADLRSRAKG
ncbi:MBL fold metallo-hydrolase [Dysosmobacter sp.]|uniref:MBL fold metallo-hydrolase n=1 Tax=Dysosmobacter sp. TaxID=2591382 RepID=UPI002A843FF6|nr:MBL fold metallo-hydrolase [Dysosmobacter sp.]MDY3281901.1 MBL fold metallo-hydrolase [Dysosmobacter sp.]